MIKPLGISSSTHSNEDLNQFKTFNNSKKVKIDMEIALEMENDNDLIFNEPIHNNSYHHHQRHQRHQSYSHPIITLNSRHYASHKSYYHISSDGISCNFHNRNRLLQISSAQNERIKNTNIESSLKNYELIKRLKNLALSHSTSVPVIIKSWQFNNFPTMISSHWYLSNFESVNDIIELSNNEINYLNEVYN